MSKKAKIIKQWSKVFLITLLLVFLVQTFFIQIFTVSSSSMESSVYKGDKVWVNKAAYGIRLPISWLAIPFVYNNILGIRSYSDKFLLNYHRLFPKEIALNDIVLFNNPGDKSKPLDRRDLLISRCIALPGDTLLVNNTEILVNGNKKPLSPDMILSYKVDKTMYAIIDSLSAIHNSLYMQCRSEGDSVILSMNRYQTYLINQSLPDSLHILPNKVLDKKYSLVVPIKDYTIDLDEDAILLFSSIILDENPNLTLKSGVLQFNDSILKQYTFKYDYYWFLSDNPEVAIDSRSFGFVSERDIIGKVFYVSSNSKKD